MQRPIMFVLAGPNGAGKTTFYKTHLASLTAIPFINADHIQRGELTDQSVEAAYKASEIAAYRRDIHLAARQSFITETVFSHSSKLELVLQANELGFETRIFHIGIVHSDLSVARVSERVKEGGHDVPEEKIKTRYDRNGPLIKQAVLMASKGYVFDNSSLNKPCTHLMTFQGGKITELSKQIIPEWATKLYSDEIDEF